MLVDLPSSRQLSGEPVGVYRDLGLVTNARDPMTLP